jgi:hypothetical protein
LPEVGAGSQSQSCHTGGFAYFPQLSAREVRTITGL